jgi:hypothetical protein
MTEHEKECICMKHKFNCLALERILDNIQHNDTINLDTKINTYDQIEDEIVKRINEIIDCESDEIQELRNSYHKIEMDDRQTIWHLKSKINDLEIEVMMLKAKIKLDASGLKDHIPAVIIDEHGQRTFNLKIVNKE